MRCKTNCPVLLVVAFQFLFIAAFSQTSQKADSLYNALKAFDLKKKTNPSLSDTIKVHLLANLSDVYFQLDNDKSMSFLKSELALSEKINYKWGIANALNAQGSLYDFKGKPDIALGLFERALAIEIETGDQFGALNVCNNIGVLYAQKGINTESLKYFFRALEIAKNKKYSSGILGCYNNIGVLYKTQSKYEEALKYYWRSIRLQLQLKDEHTLCITYQNIGEIYRVMKQPELAMKYLELGLKSAKATNNYESLANNESTLGNIYLDKGQYPQALEKHLSAMAIRQKMNDESGMFVSYINLGKIYLETGDNAKALAYTLKAARTAKGSGQLGAMAESYSQLSRIYKKSGNYKLAFENQELYKIYNDSVFNAENEKKLVEQQMNFDFKNIQEKKDRQAKAAVQKEKNIKYIGLGTSALVAFCIVFFLVRRHKTSSLLKQQMYNEGLNVLQEELTVKEIEAQMLKTENENIQLKNELMKLENEYEKGEKEKLQDKLDFNQRELASATLYLFEKNKMLSELRTEIDALPKAVAASNQIEKVKSTIQRNLYLDADWEKFRLHFEQVHPDFFKELNQKHPNLTAYEVRLYAYLHMKLATKEIATLLNITSESVITAKMRLNKKLRQAEGNDSNTSETL